MEVFQLDKKYIIIIIIVIVGIGGVILFSGGGSYTSANISDVKLSKDVDGDFNPIEVTDTFNPDDSSFHLTGQMNNVPSDIKVGVDWHYLDAEDEDNLWIIQEGETTWIDGKVLTIDQSQRVHFDLTRSAGSPPWPIGSYEARIYIEGKGSVENVQFSVQEEK